MSTVHDLRTVSRMNKNALTLIKKRKEKKTTNCIMTIYERGQNDLPTEQEYKSIVIYPLPLSSHILCTLIINIIFIIYYNNYSIFIINLPSSDVETGWLNLRYSIDNNILKIIAVLWIRIKTIRIQVYKSFANSNPDPKSDLQTTEQALN